MVQRFIRDQLKTIFDFAVLMYDTYFIHENIVYITVFVNRYNANMLVHSNKARSMIEHNIYEDYISDCVVVKPGKVTCTLLCEDFVHWLIKRHPQKVLTSHIKLHTGNWSAEFQKEFMSYIAKSLNIEYKKINLIDKRRNYNFNNVSGFVGIETKSMSIGIMKENVKEYGLLNYNLNHKQSNLSPQERKKILNKFSCV